jgi:TetR/AcrR family transcriptional regulator, cholesterol catabolism regulator
MSRREEKKRAKRRGIQQAAWALFLEQGYEATTTKQVADRAGIATGTLFLYASHKPDLLFLVYRARVRDTVEKQMASLPEAPLLAQLLHVFDGLLAMYGEHPDVARDFVKALPGAKGINADALEAYTFGFVAQLATLVAHAKIRGEVDPDVDPLLAASNIFSLYFGTLMSWLNGYVAIEHACSVMLARSLELQLAGMRLR